VPRAPIKSPPLLLHEDQAMVSLGSGPHACSTMAAPKTSAGVSTVLTPTDEAGNVKAVRENLKGGKFNEWPNEAGVWPSETPSPDLRLTCLH
jgi:hypothetical protein